MSLVRKIADGLRALFRRERVEREMEEELRAYVEMAIEEKVQQGMSREEAARAVRLERGSLDGAKEIVRAAGWESFVETCWQDLRFALRGLRKAPGFTAAVVLTLALGIGATTAIFSGVNPILFERLPYPNPNRIMMIWGLFQGARSQVTFFNYRELLERNHSFEALAIFEPWQPTMIGGTEPERLEGQNISYGYFRALGVEPVIGRDFEPSDDIYGAPHVAILSHGLWQRRFGENRSLVGRQITLDGDAYTVVGIMPLGFENVLDTSAEIWSPEQQYNPANIRDTNSSEWGNRLSLIARARPGTSLAQAKADIEMIARMPVADFPRPRWASLNLGFIVDSLQANVTREVKPGLLAVLGAVILVLLIACVNVANLLLARGAKRRGEFAMRAALGAGRVRLVQQLLSESLLLALVGGALGMLVAQLLVRALIAVSPGDLPRAAAIGVNGNAFLFGLGITSVAGFLVGLIPAIHVVRNDLQAGVKEASSKLVGSHQFTRRALVVAEVALALVLLVGAGLLLRSLARLFDVNPGFDSSNVLTMQVQTSGHGFDEPPTGRREQFFRDALENVRHTAGVESAAFTSLLPLADDTLLGLYGGTFEKDNGAPVGGGYGVFRYVVTPGFFETMRIPLRRGRFLEDGDTADAPHVVIISEALAKKEFGNQDPLGQRMKVGGFPNWPWYTIVGVVDDVKQASLSGTHLDAVYITPEQSWYADAAMSLVVRTRGNSALVPELKSAIWAVDKNQPIVRVSTMDELLAASVAQRRFTLILFEAFGTLALALAGVGIYGVLSGSVTERTREIGIRMALGAQRGEILRLFLREGSMLAVVGVGIGVGFAGVLTRSLGSLLFGVEPLDPITFLCVTFLLAAVALMASYIPARRAVHVDPIVTLRDE